MARLPNESRRDASKPFAIFTLIMLLVMIFPVYGFANSVEPMILGLPFSLFWIIAWIGVEFVGLVCFIAYEFTGGDR
ncbi:hypothetical protein JL101_011755 [Skermanella rosea]|uniref:hypothetical protein n=1 Tax=Skermanella rosea TaxID=1817965 RepID=UPI001933577C|nr:hypothetical protein [Skermanella rosea]UEM06072.1 hypothetical protein JL101_011755 [Skermanella rosea]